MHQKSTGMKKFLEKIIEGILTCSGFVTSITILLIVLFLFTEAFGLFRSKVIEEGYVLALNKSNKVSVLSPAQIKNVFDGEITNWKELGGEDLPIRVFRLEDITQYYTEEELGKRGCIGFKLVPNSLWVNKHFREGLRVRTTGRLQVIGMEAYGLPT